MRLLASRLLLLVVAIASFGASLPMSPLAVDGWVATVDPQATDAALDALRRGGNAIDAAIAAALTLGVVDGQNSGIGGGCFILCRLADGRLVAIDGRETAPAAASPEMYLRDGKPDTKLSQTGPLAVAVPSALAAYQMATEAHGRLTLADLLLPAAQIADDGFVLDEIDAERLKSVADELAQFPASRAIYWRPDGRPCQAGDRVRIADLAQTYRRIAQEGVAWFYRGPFAATVAPPPSPCTR